MGVRKGLGRFYRVVERLLMPVKDTFRSLNFGPGRWQLHQIRVKCIDFGDIPQSETGLMEVICLTDL
jgi:hypothetical protein